MNRNSLPKWTCISGGVLMFFSMFGISQAAPIPNAGELLQQIEKEQRPQLPEQTLPKIISEPQKLAPTGGVKITVKKFNFSGNTLFSNEELASVLAGYLHRPLSFIGLQKASSAIAEHYRKAGWVVRVYLPKQDVTEGIITIHIIEAVFGGVQLKGELNRLSKKGLLERISSIQAKGKHLNVNNIDRALLLLDDLPGTSVRGSLSKGQRESETNLLVTTADEPLFQVKISGDNTGPRSIGSRRVKADFYLNSPLKIGDQLVGNMIHSRGLFYRRLAYSLPIGDDGFRMGLSGSYLTYHLVGAFSSLNALGHSSTIGLNAQYPVIRTRLKNLYIGFNAVHKKFDNEVNTNTTTRYQIDDLSIDLMGNVFDKLGGGGVSNAEITITEGRDLLGHINLAENTALNGKFTKLKYNLNRHQVISNKVSAYIALRGQEANRNLDLAEKFYLGGSYGVRAYPANEGSGSSGQLLNLELRTQLLPNLILTGFYDYGHVSKTGIAHLKSYSLQGAGVSVAWSIRSRINLKATWARRIGSNPNKLSNGNDQSGTLQENRFWLQASTLF